MIIPENIKNLYKHWAFHSAYEITFRSFSGDLALLKQISDFATERMNIWYKKTVLGESRPFTDDSILSQYRFCNIYRELDRQTIEIHESIKHFETDFELWLLNLAFNRFVARPETVKRIGKISFNRTNNDNVYERLLNLPSPKYGTAYVFPISVIQRSDFPTREKLFVYYLPLKIKEIAAIIRKFKSVSVNEALSQILPAFVFNFKFHWTEILIDVAYQYPEYIDLYKDFHIGPGATPTLKLFGKEISIEDFVRTRLENFPYLEYNRKPVYLSAENWEGIFCEFRKYSNLKNGKGRKRRFAQA